MNLKEFTDYYKNYNRLPSGMYSNPNKPLNDTQIITKYNDYIKKINKQKIKRENDIEKYKQQQLAKLEAIHTVDEKWESVKQNVFNRDEGKCRLMTMLRQYNREYIDLLMKNSNGFYKIIDPAHLLARSTYPEYIYEEWNIYCLNRFSHSNLDNMKHPVYGTPINKDDHRYWWLLILGMDYETNIPKEVRSLI